MLMPSKIPLITCVPKSLFKNPLIRVIIPSNALSALFLICVHTWPKVFGILLNFAFVSSAASNRAFLTTSAVTSPSSATLLMEPSAMPIYFSIARAIPGPASRIEFSSSPRSAPDAIAWVSCSMALLCSCAEAPPMTNSLLTCSIKAIVSSLLAKAFLAFSPSLAMAEAVSRYPARDRCADAMILACSSSSDCLPSFISFRRAFADVISSVMSIIFLAPKAAIAVLITLPTLPHELLTFSALFWASLLLRTKSSRRFLALSILDGKAEKGFAGFMADVCRPRLFMLLSIRSTLLTPLFRVEVNRSFRVKDDEILAIFSPPCYFFLFARRSASFRLFSSALICAEAEAYTKARTRIGSSLISGYRSYRLIFRRCRA